MGPEIIPHLLDSAVSPQHLAKARVEAVQVGTGCQCHEELAAVGVLQAKVGT